MTPIIPLPEPDLEDHEYELWGQNVRGDFYSANQMRAYAAQAVAAEREQWKADAERWRWLAGDVDGDAQDDFITWLHGHVASRAEVDAMCDQMMAPDYRSPGA